MFEPASVSRGAGRHRPFRNLSAYCPKRKDILIGSKFMMSVLTTSRMPFAKTPLTTPLSKEEQQLFSVTLVKRGIQKAPRAL